MSKLDLKNFTRAALVDYAKELSWSPFRGNQIFSWLYRPGISDFAQMTDLAKVARLELAERTMISRLVPEKREVSEDGTIKYAFRLDDGQVIESVLIPEEDRNTLCVSSQVGCAMGCQFCLTGTMGFKRNLSPAEIVNQIMAVRDDLPMEMCNSGDRRNGCINNLVFMGMGEPLANFDNLLTALEILMDQSGLDFSGRRVTVSTCGLVPRMKELGERAVINLAVSLHSVDNKIRSQLMPVNDKYPVEVLLEACRNYPMPNRRMIMFEYILIKGLNDSDGDARQLARKLGDMRCKINLLPFNPCPGLPYEQPSRDRIMAFQKILWDAGFTVFIRFSRGGDISAACGQLASRVSAAGHAIDDDEESLPLGD
jgi:23S rRNA (adenine2503-C2)-methyltransferase